MPLDLTNTLLVSFSTATLVEMSSSTHKAFNQHSFFDEKDVHLYSVANLAPSGELPYLNRSDLKHCKSQRLMH